MRRILAVFLALLLLPIPARAANGVGYIALTFDDGPSGRFTRRLLDGLKARDVKATFFSAATGWKAIRRKPSESSTRAMRSVSTATATTA